MKTECSIQRLLFQEHGTWEVTAAFTDHRDPELTEFSALELLTPRVMGIALGYEELNDHERLRHDPLLTLLAGSRYKKIVASIGALQDALVDVFIRLKAKQGVPTDRVLDLDATDRRGRMAAVTMYA